jgi:hypothetical protein
MAKRRKKMEHPVFGSIKYSTDEWEGQVSVPFFAAYDHPPLDDSAWSRIVEAQKKDLLKEGLFDLVIQDEAGTGPTQAQERAFVHFQENQDAICTSVVAAIFPYYQKEYDNRDVPTSGFWKKVMEARFPAIEGVEGLQHLIRFGALYVLEPELSAEGNDRSQLGFAFSCTWDEEHKLGVLFHRDKVVLVGSSDVAWTPLGDF